ncbi:MAG: HAD-IIA family hydrolase [Deltaproteobacteria bacterium]|nr:HAD-IIA family hydrolase [Deltaproteobacteria bacterium]
MLEINPGSIQRLRSMKAFAMDMDGTVYLGGRLLPGAREFKDFLDGRGVPFVFLTNNSSRGRSDFLDRLTKMGLSVCEQNIMTSGEATIDYLRVQYPDATIRLFGTPSLDKEFQEAGIRLCGADDGADIVVLGFDTTLTYDRLWELCDRVRRKTPFIATHPDINCPVEDGYMPDVGSFLALIKASTGRVPDAVIGKPSKWMTAALSSRLGQRPCDIAYVGDRLYTDTAMARDSGMLAVLTLTGEASVEDLEGSGIQPDLVVDDLVELMEVYTFDQ